MKVTLSIIKADIGSNGGHICPSQQVLATVRSYIAQHGSSLLIDHYISSTGDDIAILMSHRHGAGHEAVHKLAWMPSSPGQRWPSSRGCTVPVRIC